MDSLFLYFSYLILFDNLSVGLHACEVHVLDQSETLLGAEINFWIGIHITFVTNS